MFNYCRTVAIWFGQFSLLFQFFLIKHFLRQHMCFAALLIPPSRFYMSKMGLRMCVNGFAYFSFAIAIIIARKPKSCKKTFSTTGVEPGNFDVWCKRVIFVATHSLATNAYIYGICPIFWGFSLRTMFFFKYTYNT